MARIRLNKFLAERLGFSRREADNAIASGQITVDGATAQLGSRLDLDKSQEVRYNGKIVPFQADFLYLAMHKPVGYVCSRRAQGPAPTIYELLPKKYQHLKTVGRLDKDSSGLILLTNDGDFAYRHTHPKFAKSKIYEVELDHPLEPLHQQMISDFGVMLDDGPSQFLITKAESSSADRSSTDQSSTATPNATDVSRSMSPSSTGSTSQPAPSPSASPASPTYIVVLKEGRNRQIRRTFAALGYTVTRLHRTVFGNYELSDLQPGTWQLIKVSNV